MEDATCFILASAIGSEPQKISVFKLEFGRNSTCNGSCNTGWDASGSELRQGFDDSEETVNKLAGFRSS